MAMNGFGGWGKPASGGWGFGKTGGFGGWGNASPSTQPFGGSAYGSLAGGGNPFAPQMPSNTMAVPTRNPMAGPLPGNTMATPTSNPYASSAAGPSMPTRTPMMNQPTAPTLPAGSFLTPDPLASRGAIFNPPGPIASGSGLGGLPTGASSIMQQQIDRLAGQYGQLPQGMDAGGIIAAQRAQGLNASQILSNLQNLYRLHGTK